MDLPRASQVYATKASKAGVFGFVSHPPLARGSAADTAARLISYSNSRIRRLIKFRAVVSLCARSVDNRS
jgi:hypothetical protein